MEYSTTSSVITNKQQNRKQHPNSNMRLFLLSPLLLLPKSQAWGSLGHTTVAYLATSLITPQTTTLFQSLLHNDTEHFLAGIATWADSYRYTAEGRFSGELHFIDAHDVVPTACGVVLERDCKAGVEGQEVGAGSCIVGAIRNYVSEDPLFTDC